MPSQRPPAQLSVWLGQTLVGRIIELPTDQSMFVFVDDYIEDPDRPVLSLSFYDAEKRLDFIPKPTTTRLAPFFSNLLPEAKLREYVAQHARVKSVRDLPLLQVVGEDLPGAVVVRAETDGPPPQEWKEEQVPVKPALENEALRFSLAGVQMKFSAVGSPGRGLTIPAQGKGGHWIIKLPGEFPLVPENEYSMMQLAHAAGIETAENGLVSTGDIAGLPHYFQRGKTNAFWVKRFDRTENGRVHMEDFNQLYGQYPEQKYDNYSYANMAEDLLQLAGLEAVLEFVRRLVFNAAIGNADMHLKNWTLLYPDGRTPQLSPAYDLVSTIPYIDDVRMALSLTAGVKDVRRFDRALLRRFTDRIKVPFQAVSDIALATGERIVREWAACEQDLPMDPQAKECVSQRIRTFPITAQFIG
jgi:serine/threonine-protein kinase HipA